ncbi:methyltransferase domain-containing protein [Clostridium estertheticum]|uniref:Methyltransferase domain-containing protein n=1 Tax=Clostridium estertheticum TaxID=238834 RepID=A0AA47EM92_9CLOT|nr:methyltransferase domain-containing protein [Clostridium estertheticum]MBU3157335.1 methyltransferase domain-containing protein [Clostridium estertheticum]WAG62486.1 methyltransferase domain-containing protein [Clostridium estertheticum]
MADWNSVQYLKFENERTQPAIDLVNRIFIGDPKRIIDIGCGPGNSTQVLAQRFPNAYILGVDNSSNMIETAKRDYPNLDFKTCDVSKDLSMFGNDFDVVFSNACIQWIPKHNELLKNMMVLLKIDGILAVQTPMNYQEPIHKIIAEVSINKKWKSEFSSPRIFYNLTQSQYFDLLSEISSEFSMWETIYCHKLKSHKDIMEWYRDTGLRPYLNVLSDEKKKAFEQDVFDRVVEEYPIQKNGNIIFRFPRFFFIATSKTK